MHAMLTVKDVRAFRTKYRNKKPVFRDSTSVNEHYIGTQHGDLSGFFLLFHGAKEEIENFLRANFQMAEDGQAIFEFIQNAADCGSSKFWLFFDDQYFLAINNGAPFQEAGIESILNIGQSHGKKGCDKIGRYGVGFKLVHRLVGRTDGLDEIVQQNKGPILFSWSKPTDFRNFFSLESNGIQFSDEDDRPWLMKIILTCFPAQVNETVWDLTYAEKVLFREDELSECVHYVSDCLEHIDIEKDLNQGSLFFLKLGESKAEIIQKETKDIVNGVGISMRFLTNLNSITINQNEVPKSEICWLPACKISPSSEEYRALGLTDKKVLDCAAIIEVGYLPFRDSGNIIRRAPNFFKFFPMGDEVNGLNFVIHSNIFDHETNRRKLHDQSTNHRILEAAARHICECAENADTNIFKEIFANIMHSDPPEDTGNSWQRPYFYDHLIKYAKDHVPAIGLDGANVRNSHLTTVIKNTNLEIHPREWGIQFDWFFCHKKEEAAAELLERVSRHEELKLKTWKAADLIRSGDIDSIAQWIERVKTSEAESVKLTILIEELFEISNHELERDSSELFKKCASLSVFKFSDSNYYSLNEIKQRSQFLFLEENRTDKIRHILEKIGVVTSINVIPREKGTDFGASIKNFIGIEAPEELFKKIVLNIEERISKGEYNLDEDEKCLLFESLTQIYDEKKSIRELKLFSNKKGCVLKMREIIPHQMGKGFLTNYEIDISAGHITYQKLQAYLCFEDEVFRNVVIPYWEEIIKVQSHNKIFDFIDQVTSWYLQAVNASNLSLVNQKVVFLDIPKDWFIGSRVYFHSSMKGIEPDQFKKLNTASIAITGKSLPDIRQIKLLGEAPFNIKNTKLKELEGKVSATLDYNDLAPFIELCITLGDIFFESYYVEDNEGLANVVIRTDEVVTQYHTPNDELSSIVKSLTDKAARLPGALEQFKTSDLIKRDSDLLIWVIDLVSGQDKFDEYTERLAEVINTKTAAEHFFKSVPKFHIMVEQLGEVQCKQMSWIKLIDERFTDLNKLIDIRSKVFITLPDGTEYSLADYTASSTFLVKEYELSFSGLFPNDEDFERCTATSKIYSYLKKNYLVEEEWLKNLFGVEIEEISQERGVEVLKQIPATPINASQLVLCLLTSKWDENSNRRIKASDEKEYSLNSHWLITKREFVLPSCQLHEQYNGIEKILNLDDKNPTVHIESCKFVFDFFFGEDNVLNYFGLNNEPNEEHSESAFLYLYDIWKNQPSYKWKEVNIKEFSQVLGFNPLESILQEEYALDKELIPKYVQELIISSNEYIDFLEKLGVNSAQSPIVKLRSTLLGDDVDFNIEDLKRAIVNPDEIGKITKDQIINSLHFLNGRIFYESRHIELINQLYASVPSFEGKPDFPIMYIFSREKGVTSYQVLKPVANHIYIDESFIKELQRYQISIQHLVDSCDAHGFRLIDLTCFQLQSTWGWIEILSLSEPQPDWELVIATSKQWDAEYYMDWKKEDRPEIWLFSGNLPESIYLVEIDEVRPIKQIRTKDFLVHPNCNIFINGEKDILPLLNQNYSSMGLSLGDINDLLLLANQGKPSIQIEGDGPFFPNGIGSERAGINDEAKRQAATWLRGKGYFVPEPLNSNYYRLIGIRDRNGDPLIVHVRSSRAGNLYIYPNDWEELSQSNALLLVVLPGGRITSLTFEDLMQSKSPILLEFNSQIFTPEGLVAFGKLFQYIPGVNFIIRSNNFSVSDEIKSFGLNRILNEEVKPKPTTLID
jgi:hypothetical protein